MATQQELELKINTSVDAGNSAASIREIRNQIKELNSIALQFGEDFPEAARKAQQEAAKLSDRLDDTKEGLNDLKGEPLERIRASVGRLQEGFSNLDLGKITLGFKNLGAAVFSVGGIFALLYSGVMLIIQNFDTLKNSGGIIGSLFTTIGNIATFLKDTLINLGDAIGLVDKAMIDQMAKEKEAKESKEKLTTATKLYNDEQDRELQLMKAKGATDEQVLKKQLQILKDRLAADKQARETIRKNAEQEIKNNLSENVFGSDRNVLGVPVNPLFKQQKEAQKEIVKEKEKISLLNEKEIDDINFQIDLLTAQLGVKKEVVKKTEEETKEQSKLNKIRTESDIEYDRRNDKFLKNRDLQIEREKTILDLNKQIKDSFVNVSDTIENIDYEELERIKQKEEAYKNLGSTFDKMAQTFNSGGNLIAESIAKSFGNVRESITTAINNFKNDKDKFVESALAAASAVTAGIGNLLSANISQQIADSKRQTDERLNDLNKQSDAFTNSLNEQLNLGKISEDEYNKAKYAYQEEYNRKKYELELAQFEKETELKRQAFEQNKAIQIVQAIILSTQAALAAYLSGMQAGGPFGPAVGGIFAGIAAAFGAIQIALIASQQFPGNGAAPTRPQSAAAPPTGGTIPNPVAIADIGGRLTSNNQQEEMRVYVLEKDITQAQNKSAQIKDRSRR